MKRYKIEPQEREFNWGKMQIITLGERGRGRQETLIPYHAPEDAEFLCIAPTKSGKPKIVESKESEGWLACVSSAGAYTRDTYGTMYVQPKDVHSVSIVAAGNGAYGAAGRVEYWYDFLLQVADRTFLKVRPAGGYKVDSYWLYFGEEKVARVEKPEMAMFCDVYGIDQPDEEYAKLVDLVTL